MSSSRSRKSFLNSDATSGSRSASLYELCPDQIFDRAIVMPPPDEIRKVAGSFAPSQVGAHAREILLRPFGHGMRS